MADLSGGEKDSGAALSYARPGGRRKGTPKTGGRAKGTPNKATAARMAAFEQIINNSGLSSEQIDAMTPLDVMLFCMRAEMRAGHWAQAASYARDCAPFLHPRLNTNTNVEISKRDPSELSDAELAAVVLGERAGKRRKAVETEPPVKAAA